MAGDISPDGNCFVVGCGKCRSRWSPFYLGSTMKKLLYLSLPILPMSAGLGRSLLSRHATRIWTATRRAYPRTAVGALHRTAPAALSTTFIRSASGAAAAVNHPTTSGSPAPSLREVFDGPPASTSRSLHASAAPPVGLFLYSNLMTPQTFMDSVSAAIARGHLLVERIANAPERGEHEMRKVVKIFDRLSDVICRVIDAAEVVQCLHPDRAWRRGAETVFEEMFSWMNTLNTDPRLYKVRKKKKKKKKKQPLLPLSKSVVHCHRANIKIIDRVHFISSFRPSKQF